MAAPQELPFKTRLAVLVAAFLGLLFDGVELGLMPIASLSVSQSLLGDAYTPTLGGDWFARFTAALMLGAAIGGIVLGRLGDRIGRTRAMGISILFYSAFAGMGAFVHTQEQMLTLRFLVGLGVGGMWPNGVALVNECWRSASRPFVSGITGAGIAVGILMLSQLARIWPITPESWRWVFALSCGPIVLAFVVLAFLPESPTWIAAQGVPRSASGPPDRLFDARLRRTTIIGIILSAVPMIGAWAGSKWMIPWADKVAGAAHPEYKAVVQGWWAFGSAVGSFLGAQLASALGRRTAYFVISLLATTLTVAMFQATAPMLPSFLFVVFAQGFASTLFFGWLPLYLPELFPTSVRAVGCGLAYNSGRFLTAFGVLGAGMLFVSLGGSYPIVGTACAMIYALGMIAIWWAPSTKNELGEEVPDESARSSTVSLRNPLPAAVDA